MRTLDLKFKFNLLTLIYIYISTAAFFYYIGRLSSTLPWLPFPSATINHLLISCCSLYWLSSLYWLKAHKSTDLIAYTFACSFLQRFILFIVSSNASSHVVLQLLQLIFQRFDVLQHNPDKM